MPLLYYLVLRPFSLLPSWILYGISNGLFFVVYHLVGYRKAVVRANLQNSFPELSAKKRLDIEREFFVHFCDLIVESVKAFSISEFELDRRFTHRNPEIFQKFFDKGQHVTLVGGHNGNWELFAVSVARHLPHQPLALFTPLNNKFMNNKIMQSRSKFGLWMKSYEEAKQIVKDESKPVTFIFGSDQCPKHFQKPYFTEFLNQETAVQFGTEKFSRDNNTPVIYGFIHKVKRGYYEMEYKLVCENPGELQVGMISEMHTRMLEGDIKNEPSYWLWTHKRWKRKRKDFDVNKEELKSVA
ncbi:MAG TPA: lysophospholipid acyltransferase family protein [Cyclobacteriaceae bacterium]|nr:lysophospholipid acyltransferase family protein [Cyclobacteriaceae bacterium]HRK53587.1 lysophospholipid acyltransferase family protein [Cyclobacteriaceae bacterium]